MKKIIIAIDGPAGSGKSTTAMRVADRLNYLYIDTGAMYRAVTYLAIKNNFEPDDPRLIDELTHSEIRLNYRDEITSVFLNDKDITGDIRTPEINQFVSPVSKVAAVRQELIRQQRIMGKQGGVVMEGRDIGTIVFPDADLKIFMVAELQTRAQRRLVEYASAGKDIDFSDVKENLEHRDKIDSSREVGPLMKAADAVEVDTTNLTIEEQVKYIVSLAEEKRKGTGTDS